MSNRSGYVAMEHNGLADKSSCHVLAQWQRKDFSRNSSYPLVSGSAEGTIRRSVAYRQPVSENRMQESPKGRCIRAVGIFANVPTLGVVANFEIQMFSLKQIMI